MKTDNLKVAVVQMTALDDFQYNTQLIHEILHKLPSEEVDIVFFPENCLYLRLDKKQLPPFLELDAPQLDTLKKMAEEKNWALHLGGVGIKSGEKQYNASLFIDPSGNLKHSYSKQSLFDIDIEGGHSYRESDAYSKGEGNQILEYKGWRFGQSICYDLRFSKIYYQYAMEGVDAMLVPSSFLVPTGRAHWHTLNRARAIETQSYVISAAQAGSHKDRHHSYGHSLVVDPWGDILLDMEDVSNEVRVVTLSKERISKIRTQMPMRL